MKKVVVIGGTGMLGSMLVDVLRRNKRLKVFAAFRGSHEEWTTGDVEWFRLPPSLELPPHIKLQRGDWLINAAGLIIHRIDIEDPRSILNSIESNAALPHRLFEVAKDCGARFLQITTDCVFSGSIEGWFYTETDSHDELHVYGRTKSLGEVNAPGAHNLRCSIVGPECNSNPLSLFEWFMSHPTGARIRGYTNHFWNGLTTLACARVVEGVIDFGLTLPNVLHVTPSDLVDKLTLLRLFQKHFDRGDITIEPFEHLRRVNRCLGTSADAQMRLLWSTAGYEGPPSVEDMVRELSAFDCGFRSLR